MVMSTPNCALCGMKFRVCYMTPVCREHTESIATSSIWPTVHMHPSCAALFFNFLGEFLGDSNHLYNTVFQKEFQVVQNYENQKATYSYGDHLRVSTNKDNKRQGNGNGL